MEEESVAEQVEREMRAQGQATDEPVPVDYFGFSQTFKVMLPDKVSYIEHEKLNEGARRDYLNKTNRQVRLQRATGDAVLNMAAGDDRHHLLKMAIVGWNLQRGGQPVEFTKKNLEDFLEKADPKIIDLIEKDVRKNNAWLLQDISIEDIDQQIKELEELKEEKVKEEEGKG